MVDLALDFLAVYMGVGGRVGVVEDVAVVVEDRAVDMEKKMRMVAYCEDRNGVHILINICFVMSELRCM